MSDARPSRDEHAQRLAVGVYEDALLDRCRYLSRIGFWAGSVSVDAEAWLSNFGDEGDRRHALHLLGALQFYNITLCQALIASGIEESVRRASWSPEQPVSAYARTWADTAERTRLYTLPGVSSRFRDA